MKVFRAVVVVAIISVLAGGLLFGQEIDKEALKKKVLKRVEELLKLEEKRILDEVSDLIDRELAKNAPKTDKNKKGKDKPGYLGVVPGELDDDKKEELKFEGDGVLIAQVQEGTPAQKAGIQEDDVITEIGDDEVADPMELRDAIMKHKAGETIPIKLWRDGKEKTIKVKLAPRPSEEGEGEEKGEPKEEQPKEEKKKEKPSEQGKKTAKPGFLGVSTAELDDDKKAELKYKGDKGVLIQQVVPDSPADVAGLEEDDIILSVSGKDAEDPNQLRELIGGHRAGEKVKIVIWRDGKEKTLDVKLAPRPGEEEEEKGEEKEDEQGKGDDKDKKPTNAKLKEKVDKFLKTDKKEDGKGGNVTPTVVKKPFLGIQVDEVKDKGLKVVYIVYKGPAETAELKEGDVITTIDGKRVEDEKTLADFMKSAKAGQEVKMTIIREDKETTVNVTLGER